jgi:hypothetical protein
MSIADLTIPFNDFKSLEIIDSEQFDLNNSEICTKINAVLTVLNQLTDSISDGGSGADKISLTAITPFVSTKLQSFLEEVMTRLRSTTDGASGADFLGSTLITGVSGVTIQAQLENLKSLLDSHRSSLDAKDSDLQTQITSNTNRVTSLETQTTSNTSRVTSLETQATSNTNRVTSLETRATNVESRAGSLESRVTVNESSLSGKANKVDVYTRAELNPYLQGGDTEIIMEVFTIVSGNNGDGTFTYANGDGVNRTGTLTPEGYQTFTLEKKSYIVGSNRMSAIIGDTLHRSVASGGLIETSANQVTLSVPEGSPAEIAFTYFYRVGVTGEHSVSVGSSTPAPSDSLTLWMKVL